MADFDLLVGAIPDETAAKNAAAIAEHMAAMQRNFVVEPRVGVCPLSGKR